MPASLFRKDAFKRGLLTYGPLLAALVLEVIVFELISQRQGIGGFASVKLLILVLDQSAIYGVMAVGMTFVILTGGIDLSVGSVLAFGGVLCAMVVQWGGEPLWLWIPLGWGLALLAGSGVGASVGLLVTRLAIPPFIATLAFMSSLRGLGNIFTDGKPISPLPVEYTWLGRYQIGGNVPVSMTIFLLVLVLGAVLLNRTRFGRHVRAIGEMRKAPA